MTVPRFRYETVALQKTGESAGLSTGGDMDSVERVYALMVAVGVVGFAATLAWILAG
jgi:hypothetical protein